MRETETPNADLDPAPRWRLQLCGQPLLLDASGTRVMLERRDAAMLAMLAIDGATSRGRIMAMLWPDEPPEVVRGRLRQRIHALKRKLGTEAVEGGATLALGTRLHWPGFDDEPDGPLLGDDAHAEQSGFAQWLQQQRLKLQSLRRERLAGRASALEGDGRLAEAIVVAEQLLAIEPLQEHAHRRLMRLHYLRGDRAAALLAFDRCEELLKNEVGATPSAETLDLLAQIDRAKPLATAPGSPVPRVVPASVLRPPRLVGRDAEWRQLRSAWERGDAIVVIGEAGMGKSRLIGDLVQVQADTTGHALQVSARPGDERVPYALLARLLRALLATRTRPLPEGVEAELARLLPELPPRDRRGDPGDAAAQARFIGALETTLRDAVDTGLQALVLDDLHFADTASLEMAQHLAGAAGLRWLVALRGAEIGPAAQALVDQLVGTLRAEPIRLQALTAAQVAELVDTLGVDGLDAASVAGALHQHSGGNPLFLLETLKAWLLRGEWPRGDTPAAAGGLALLPVAGSVARLIERRIGLLSPAAVQLARCAAVAGQDFSAALAAHVLEVHPLALTDAWLELESAQVLRDAAFAHDLIHEAARASVPEPIARVLHLRIAGWLDGRGAEPARRAAHWLGAGDELRAAPCLVEAGRAALLAMRITEGLGFLDRAQAIYGRHGDSVAQLAVIDEFEYPARLAGKRDDVMRVLEQAVAHATSDRTRSMGLSALASFLSSEEDSERADALARRALECALAAGDRGCELSARVQLAALQGDLGRADAAPGILEPIEEWVMRDGDDDQRLEYTDAKAMILTVSGQLARGRETWARALEIARTTGAAHTMPQILTNMASNDYFMGYTRRARDGHLDALALLGETPEHSTFVRRLKGSLILLERELGHFHDALTLADEQVAVEDAMPHAVLHAQAYASRCYLDLGQPVRARQRLARCDGLPVSGPMEFVVVELRVDAAAGRPEADDVRTQAVQAATQALAGRSGRTQLPVWRVLARFASDEAAIQAGRQALDFASATGSLGYVVLHQALLAQRLAAVGRIAEAARLAHDALASPPEVTPAVVYRGWVWKALIEALEATGDDATCRQLARAATEWVLRTAADHVPPPFRESFLRRNPANAFLLSKAGEL